MNVVSKVLQLNLMLFCDTGNKTLIHTYITTGSKSNCITFFIN
uniref:Hypotheticial protein n=1 Tax=Schistosoma japonicum TaxID=6182 RepID=C1L8H0_SCHJA|nr:hypotheticial protein [Schistosoma japonicum]